MSNYVFDYCQYRKNLSTKNNFNFITIFLLIIILLGMCVFLKPIKTSKSIFYYVEIDNFQTYKDAQKLSYELQNFGTNSLIFFDKTYHVLVGFYSIKNHAKTVS